MKTIKLVLMVLALAMFASHQGVAQKSKKPKYKSETNKPKAFRVHQHVMVTMKDGSQVEAVVHGHISKKKYWVRQWHSGREGKVHEKYMRALSESEVTELKKTKKK
ncbi:hypothetical protein [Reichenbachiella sp.]|uniref:hypothetical protein n=1 Tax=Reichenbachiella sp. TaxID=2184521 RepID=UPI003BAEC42D